MVIEDFEKREFNYGCGVVTQNFLLNYSLFKIIVNPNRKMEFSSEKQKDMSDDGSFSVFFPKKFQKEKRSFPASRIFVLDCKFRDKSQKIKTNRK